MINRLRHFFVSQRIFSAFSLFFLIYVGVFFLNHLWSNSLIAFLQLIGGLFFLTFGTGMSLTLILQWPLKRNFDLWEFISLSLLGSLLIPPLILNGEFSLFNTVEYWYPLANSFILWCTAGILLFFNKTSLPPLSLNKFSIKHPLTFTLLFGVIFTAIQVLSFQPLPDLDPYKWLFKYTYQFSNHILDTYERPLFGSLIYITTALTGIKIFDFFKYLLPFFLLLTLFPAWMVAKTFPEKSKQWLFLLFVFASPSTLLYASTAMPQVPLIIISYFFIFFLLYSSIKKDNFFLYAAGSSMLLAFFYHQAAFVVFIAWILPVIVAKRKMIFSDKKTLSFIVIILLTNLQRFQGMYDFAANWAEVILPSFLKVSNVNLLYPAQYTNTDNNMMGWNSLGGVIKFYSFYVGPIIGLVLLYFVWRLLQKKFRSYIFGQIKNNTALVVALFSFIIFFTIAEIFPRFPGIALLPDRAWIFCGIFAFVFLYLMLKYVQKISLNQTLLFFLFFAIGIFGTLYINFSKRYLISPMQLESAEWIKSNLPEERIFLSYGYKSLLPVHAATPLIRIPASIYCDKSISEFQKTFNDFAASHNEPIKKAFLEEHYRPFLEKNFTMVNDALQYLDNDKANVDEKYSSALGKKVFLTDQLDSLPEPLINDKITIINPLSSVPQISAPILNEEIYRFDSIASLDTRPLYIYYSRLNLKNPYRGRPYAMASWGIEPCPDGKFLFDGYPDMFKRVYDTKDTFDEVIIWKVLFTPLEVSEKK